MAFGARACVACGRDSPVHEHHLIPRSCGGLNLPTVYLCQFCHGAVHGRQWNGTHNHSDLVRSGIARKRAEGKRHGRPQTPDAKLNAVRERLLAGEPILRIVKALGVGASTVQRVRHEEMAAGRQFARPSRPARISDAKLAAVAERLSGGEGVLLIAKALHVGVSTVQRIKRERAARVPAFSQSDRVKAGLERAKSQGIVLGRPKVAEDRIEAVRARLQAGEGMVRIAKTLGVGVSTVQRVKAEMAH